MSVQHLSSLTLKIKELWREGVVLHQPKKPGAYRVKTNPIHRFSSNFVQINISLLKETKKIRGLRGSTSQDRAYVNHTFTLTKGARICY